MPCSACRNPITVARHRALGFTGALTIAFIAARAGPDSSIFSGWRSGLGLEKWYRQGRGRKRLAAGQAGQAFFRGLVSGRSRI